MSKSISLVSDFLIKTIQDLLLNSIHPIDTAFAATVRVDFDDYSSDVERRSICGYVHVSVLHTQGGGGYKRVFAAFSDRPCGFSGLSWQLVCSHDSAWRDDGVRHCIRSGYNAAKKEALGFFGVAEKSLTESIQIDQMSISSIEAIFGRNDPKLLIQSRYEPEYPKSK